MSFVDEPYSNGSILDDFLENTTGSTVFGNNFLCIDLLHIMTHV